MRYPLVGGTRERRFAGTNSKPRKLPENAQTPTTMAPTFSVGDRVHAVLGGPIYIETTADCTVQPRLCDVASAITCAPDRI